MFNKLVKKLFNVLFASEQSGDKKKKNQPAGGKVKHNSRRREKFSEPPHKKPQRRKTTPVSVPGKVSAAVIKPAQRPPRPEKLQDVEVQEGKMRFLDLNLAESVQFGVQYAGFKYCTPIQQMTLPALLEFRDLAGKAQTGTGKTAAFLLASFTRLLNNIPVEQSPGTPRMVVLAPTRELAIQIHKDACELGVFTDLRIALVFGGMDHELQRRSLAGNVDVLIGTPGRVIDFARSGALKLHKVEILVIDEADRMLDMGFIPDVKRIVSQMPRKGERQTLLFSATLEEKILHLASGWLADPVVIESEPEKMVSDNIEQTFYSVLREEKLALLLYLLRTMEYERVIIFGNRKDVNLRLQYDLARYGFTVPLLSGDISQDKRIKILEKFRSGAEKIVIATDVAARGIHVDNVSLVINYDLPEQPEDYIHRIGRTGRAGHHGVSISFLCEYGAYYLPPIEELLNAHFSSILPDEKMLQLPDEVKNITIPDPDKKSPRGNCRRYRRNGRGGNFRR